MYFHEEQIPVSHFLCIADYSLSFRCIAATAMGTGQSQERQIQMIGMS
jgi:hypothetical protein